MESVLDVLGLIGFTVRSDKHKNAWKKLDRRVWGKTVAGFTLSAQAEPSEVTGDHPVKLRVALRNDTGAEVREQISAGLGLFEVRLVGPEGKLREPTNYGHRLIRDAKGTRMNLVLAPSEAIQNEIPISELFEMSAPGTYHTRAVCQVPGAAPGLHCESNEVAVKRV